MNSVEYPQDFLAFAALNDFRDALLPGTIANALMTPFYRDRWGDLSTKGFDRLALADLPLIDKEDIRKAGEDAQVRDGVVCNEVFTSGTMGNPLITVRSDREQQYINEFFSRVLEVRPASMYLRGLRFTNPYHGHQIAIPGPVHFHRVSIYDAGSFDYGRRTLLKTHRDANVAPRCTILSGLERCLRAFTLDTLSEFPDGVPETDLQIILSHSQFLTECWRDRFESTWGAKVVDRFGISEVFGGATRSLTCGWYHFEPVLVPEVVGARSHRVITEGVGLLAVTSLFPFQQAQPLVRYLTGDLVEVTHERSSRPGTLSIKPLGRARFGIPEPDSDNWLITPSSILEAVDEIPELCRTQRFSDVGQVSDPRAVGHPIYRTRSVSKAWGLRVCVDLVISDSTSVGRRSQIQQTVAADVKRRNPRLVAAIAEGRAELTVEFCDDVEPDLISQAHSGGVWSSA